MSHFYVGRKRDDDVMNELKIDQYRIIESADEKPYCVYIVEVKLNRRKYTVEKRYSQFHSLHNELRRSLSTPYFPPKKVRSLQAKVLEKRRKALEDYMQTMLKFNQSRVQVLSFLGISKSVDQSESAYHDKPGERKLEHQPIFEYKKDFIPGCEKSSIPDIVTEGVLLGLYKCT